MNSRIYTGHVAHTRTHSAHHSFRYPVHFIAVDLDELDEICAGCRLFGHNRLRPLSLWDRDYLQDTGGPIRDRLMRHLQESACDDGVERVTLVTSARYLNYAFNPVSFYYCRRRDGSLRCAVAEVNNTFGERHLYVLPRGDEPAPDGYIARLFARKEFHVSPFNDMEGRYEFLLSEVAERVDIRVHVWRDGELAFTSQLEGTGVAFTDANLLRTIAGFPLSALMTMPRILVQAAALHWGKRLPVFGKPNPSSPMTIGFAPPKLMQRLCGAIVARALKRLRRGSLTMALPGGRELAFGGKLPGSQARLTVCNHSLFTRLAISGDVGLGEGYTAGDWDSDDVAAVVAVFAENLDEFDDRAVIWTQLARTWNRIGHLFRANSRTGSRRNIEAHYDLGNSFYEKFLDRSMTYSCALYQSPDESLETAQGNKIEAMIRKAQIQPGDRVLEIGSGWGALAIEAARRAGCHVTAVTLSSQQFDAVRAKVDREGVADRVEVLLRDYRELEGRYDRIVSVEMLEAVGQRYLGQFFAKCESLLRPGGLMALQVITIPDERYKAYSRGCDWVQKHVFPGGFLPSLSAIRQMVRDCTNFRVESVDNIGTHYARTLRDWRSRFTDQASAISNLGFDRQFQRMWTYYFAYCEAAFATKALDVHQIVLSLRDESQTAKGREFAG